MNVGRVKAIKNHGEFGFISVEGQPDGLFHELNGKVVHGVHKLQWFDLRNSPLKAGDLIFFMRRDGKEGWIASPWIGIAFTAHISLRTNENTEGANE